MPEIIKPDSLGRRVQKLADDSAVQRATLRRKLLRDFVPDVDSTNSTSYVDLGPAVTNVVPGPDGFILVAISAQGYFIQPGEGMFVSARISGGPTVVAADDLWAWYLENGNGNADGIAAMFTREAEIGPLDAGVYTVTLCIRSANGGTVTCAGRGLTVQPI